MNPSESKHMKQPHEGVVGYDRPDDPLLSPEGSDVALRLMTELDRTTLVGNPAPLVADLYKRMNAPIVGDPVVVIDARFMGADAKYRAVGYLLEHRAEWAQTDEAYAAETAEYPEESGERLIEDYAYYVQYGPQAVDICRWADCRVLAMPPFNGPKS